MTEQQIELLIEYVETLVEEKIIDRNERESWDSKQLIHLRERLKTELKS